MNIEKNNTVGQDTIAKSKSFKSLETYLKIGGFAGIIFGFIHVWSIISQGFMSIRLGDAIINIVMGALFLICKRLLSNRKFIVVWVFAFTILLSVIYSFAVGRGFNYIYAIIGAIILYKLINLKNSVRLAQEKNFLKD